MLQTLIPKPQIGASVNNSGSGRGRVNRYPIKMEHFPTEITTKILLNLPVQSLFQCRSVCKAWCRIIDNPHFSNSHFDASILSINNPSISSSSSSLILVPTILNKGKLCFVQDSNTLFKLSDINFAIPTDGELYLIGCSNGFLCISSSSYSIYPVSFYVCNPASREYTRLLVPRFLGTDVGRDVFTSGFGFDPSSKEFKVVLVRRWYERAASLDLLLDFQVYTLGASNSWRCVEWLQTSLDVAISQSNGVFVSGSLHWLCEYDWFDMEVPMGIIYFDLEHETVGIMTNLELSFKSCPDFDARFQLGELGGRLSLSDCSLVDRYEIGVMKDYNVKESWTKQFVIRKHLMGWRSFTLIVPICFLKNGELLLLCNSVFFVSYNLETGLITQLEDIDTSYFGGSYQAFPYFGTLISPKSVHNIENDV